MKSGERLLICGASARAAAFTAVRAGLAPFAIDLFGDADLADVCPVVTLPHERYPSGFVELAREQAPPGPWLYTGGLENHPNVVATISSERVLWGTEPNALRAVRDPFRVGRVLKAAGLACPEVVPADAEVPTDGSWLLKPFSGSGGSGIVPWRGQQVTSRAARGHYLQRRIDGEPHAAIYLGDGHMALLLGVTRQLVGAAWLHAKPFAYCGSIGPIVLPKAVEERLVRLGLSLVNAFPLRGLFGVDFLLQNGEPWLVEVNPRYTASVEVLELALWRSFLSMVVRHFEKGARCVDLVAAGWGHGDVPVTEPLPLRRSKFVAKCVYYARACAEFNLDASQFGTACADIPHHGARLMAGQPILTRLEVGDSVEECLDVQRYAAAWLDRRLYGE